MAQNVRRISRQLIAYGTADVMVLPVNFLLLPVYTRVLSPREYGALAILLVCEAVLKVVDRWGLDASFLRLYYDYPTEAQRKTLASTIAAFIGVVNGAIALLLLAAAAPINRLLFDSLDFTFAFRLLVLNTFALAFLFLPLNLLRIQERSRLFATLTFLRSFGTVLARLVLVVGLGLGILGIVLADVVVTLVLLAALAGTTRRMLAWRFSPTMLRELLAYGFPHVPHGLLSQTTAMVDRLVLGMYLPLRDVGLYLIGSTIASVLKLFPVAFAAAWMPFAFESSRRRDAAELFARIGTYAFAVLAFVTLALAGLASPVVELALPATYHPAASVVPLLTLGMAVQSLGSFLATSLNIAKQTRFFPLIAAVGAASSVAANLLLIPPLGLVGAAIALVCSQSLTTAVTAYYAQRAYRIPYELRRLAKVLAVSVLAYVAMTAAGSAFPWQTLERRAALLMLFPVGLLVLRFFEPHEWAEIRALFATFRRTAVQSDETQRLSGAVPTDQ